MTQNETIDHPEQQEEAPAPEPAQPHGLAREGAEGQPSASADDGPAPAAPEDEAAGDREEIGALQAERDEINERLLRTAAELQNVRRRAEQEKGRLITASKARVISPLLEVLDDFERTLDAAEQMDAAADAEQSFQALKEGVALVGRKLQEALAQQGVESIEALGEPFDEARHEALMQQPAPDDTERGTVLQEVQKGYRLGDRVLRHSKVVVAS